MNDDDKHAFSLLMANARLELNKLTDSLKENQQPGLEQAYYAIEAIHDALMIIKRNL